MFRQLSYCVVVIVALAASIVNGEYYSYCVAPNDLYVNKPSNLVLQMVQTVTRHGDRTMITRFTNDKSVWTCNLTFTEYPSTRRTPTESVDRLYRKTYLPNREVIAGDCALGQLTNKGYDQHVALGQQLRKLYVDTYKFLSPNFDPTEIWLRSTDVPRTIQSAQASIIGMYPNLSSNVSTILPVIDINTMDSDTEDMVANPYTCPAVVPLAAAIEKQAAFVQFQQKFQPLQNALQTLLMGSSQPALSWSNILDGLSALQCNDYPFPQNVTQDMANSSYEAANWEYYYSLQNTTLVSLTIGTFYSELLSRMENVISGLKEPKYLLYSGHDSTIAPFLAGMGLYNGTWPPYASHVEVELWSDSAKSNWYVQVKPNGQPLEVEGCSDVLCPYEEFSNALSSLVPTYQDCNPPSFSSKKQFRSPILIN
eukprot:TRINITY_DN1016_c0_g1_i1.p1 TRINITY_DN1016_c0_g1~~TRINITY_DN1016_c0_g1_i1.p1  ORF type:complete len:424 (+),score=67.74 TRINITY_DN1016_c0_g1_i1:307-1578(+)